VFLDGRAGLASESFTKRFKNLFGFDLAAPPRTTTAFGNQAWFRSSGCWKCTRMYTLIKVTRIDETTATTIRNQLNPSAAMVGA
jgi:hypothetical protein